MLYDELTRKHLNRLAGKIKSRMPVNTGDAANSLEIKDNALYGNDYIYFLDQGRSPGKFPPVQNIQEWVRSQLGISDEKEVKQVAFLVGRKIANEGTDIFRNKSKGIRLGELVEETLNELEKELPDQVAAEALTFINEKL